MAIGAALGAVSLCVRCLFPTELYAHRRVVRIVVTTVMPVLVLGGATLGATGNLHSAAKAALGGLAVSWLTTGLMRYVPLQRRRALPAGVGPDLDHAYRQHLRRF